MLELNHYVLKRVPCVPFYLKYRTLPHSFWLVGDMDDAKAASGFANLACILATQSTAYHDFTIVHRPPPPSPAPASASASIRDWGIFTIPGNFEQHGFSEEKLPPIFFYLLFLHAFLLFQCRSEQFHEKSKLYVWSCFLFLRAFYKKNPVTMESKSCLSRILAVSDGLSQLMTKGSGTGTPLIEVRSSAGQNSWLLRKEEISFILAMPLGPSLEN